MKRTYWLVGALMWLLVGCMPVLAAPDNEQQTSLIPSPSPTATIVRPPGYLLPPTATPWPSPTPQATPTRTPAPTSTPLGYLTPIPKLIQVGPDLYPADVNPLTGLTLDEPAIMNRRPLAVKVTNFPRSTRPQAGLMKADLVYEYYVEWGMTRFIALYYGQDGSKVGPVRSGRFFDEHIVRMYDALFAFKSADRRVLEPWLESDLLTRLIIPRTDAYGCPPICQEGAAFNYNGYYADTSEMANFAIRRGADNNRYDQRGMFFQSITPWGGSPALTVNTRYSQFSYNTWTYNPDTTRYERSAESEDEVEGVQTLIPLYDKLTNERVAADNVIVLYVPHTYYVKTNTTEMVKIHLLGSGPAKVFRDGQGYDTVWMRVGETDPLLIFRNDAANTPFPLKPGNTFFQVIGSTSDLEVQDSLAEWRFQFDIP